MKLSDYNFLEHSRLAKIAEPGPVNTVVAIGMQHKEFILILLKSHAHTDMVKIRFRVSALHLGT